jgi:hypothetical protein
VFPVNWRAEVGCGTDSGGNCPSKLRANEGVRITRAIVIALLVSDVFWPSTVLLGALYLAR